MGLERMAYRMRCTLVALVGGGVVMGLGLGHAANFSALFPDGQPSTFLPLPTPTREADSFEARLGVFAHSVGATEAGGVDATSSGITSSSRRYLEAGALFSCLGAGGA